MPAESIDTIKNRIMRNASRIWGYPDTQDINSFDPILNLLIGSLAEELHNISGEIEKTEARIAEKALELIFKNNTFTHFPAHGIVQATPLEPNVKINEFYQFVYNKTVYNKDNDEASEYIKKIYFTPTGNFDLLKGSVRYLFAGGQLYENTGQIKKTLSYLKSGKIHNYLKLFLGLELDPRIEKLDGLNLLFLVKNLQEQERFYQSLSSAKFRIGNREVFFNQGFEIEPLPRNLTLAEFFQKEKNLTRRCNDYVNEFYNQKFFTLSKGDYFREDFIQDNMSLPEELASQFPAELQKSLSKNITWIEVLFTQPFSPEFYSDLSVYMNCFPIINRELNESTYTVIKGLNVIPLKTEDIYFDLKKVTDSAGTIYSLTDNISSEKIAENTCIIRQSGIARFDSRDARQILKQSIELVKNESIAFSALGSEGITSELKQLNQIINRLQQRLERNTTADDVNSYLLLQSRSNYERVFVQYWSTCGEMANNIRMGSKLTVDIGNDLDDKGTILLTNTYGGRQKLSEEDKLNRLRSLLLSNGRIVTLEDIKALAFDHFGNDLINVEIKKGVRLDPSHQKGFVRTLDIFLFLKERGKMNEEELNHRLEGLKTKLKQGSVNLLPFRILLG